MMAATLDPATTAIVAIEFQHEFTTEGGKLHGAVAPVMKETNMLEKTSKIVEAARAKGVTIMHVPINFTADYRELAQNPFGILANIKAGQCFPRGQWASEFCESMQPKDGDIIVAGKRGLCAFASTDLDFLLRHKGIRTIVLAGFLTNCCVESTMRSAYERGFNVITLTDCCAATSPEAHKAAVDFTFPMFSRPHTADEFLALL
eukprot:Colp12_sorted_trinity150504_noHs@4395